MMPFFKFRSSPELKIRKRSSADRERERTRERRSSEPVEDKKVKQASRRFSPSLTQSASSPSLLGKNGLSGSSGQLASSPSAHRKSLLSLFQPPGEGDSRQLRRRRTDFGLSNLTHSSSTSDMYKEEGHKTVGQLVSEEESTLFSPRSDSVGSLPEGQPLFPVKLFSKTCLSSALLVSSPVQLPQPPKSSPSNVTDTVLPSNSGASTSTPTTSSSGSLSISLTTLSLSPSPPIASPRGLEPSTPRKLLQSLSFGRKRALTPPQHPPLPNALPPSPATPRKAPPSSGTPPPQLESASTNEDRPQLHSETEDKTGSSGTAAQQVESAAKVADAENGIDPDELKENEASEQALLALREEWAGVCCLEAPTASKEGATVQFSGEVQRKLAHGSFEQIAQWLVINLSSDPQTIDDLRAFLLTYRTFAPPEELLDAVRQIQVRFQDQVCWKALSRRLSSFLFEWALRWSSRDFTDSALASHLLEFSKQLLLENQLTELKLLLVPNPVTRKGSRRSVQLSSSSSNLSSNSPPSPLKRTNSRFSLFQRTKSGLRLGQMQSSRASPSQFPTAGPESVANSISQQLLTNYKAFQIAREITALELELLLTIEVGEFLNQAWAGKNSSKNAPNLSRMADRFNSMSRWVATEILLSAYSKKRQIKLMKKFIRIAQSLLDLCNYNSMMQIITGLNNPALQRLKLKDELPSKYKDTLERLMEALSPNNNYRNLRNAEKQNPPCIPALVVLLRDLTFIEDGNLSRTEDGKINFEKQKMLSAAVSDFWHHVDYFFVSFSSGSGWFTPPDTLWGSLKEPWHLKEEELYSYSLICEPMRNRRLVNLRDALQTVDEWLRARSGNKEKSGKKPVRLVKRVPSLKLLVEAIRKKKKTLESQILLEEMILGFLALVVEWIHENQDQLDLNKAIPDNVLEASAAAETEEGAEDEQEKVEEEQLKSMKAAVGFIDFLPEDIKEVHERERREQLQKVVDVTKELLGQVSTWIKVLALCENVFLTQQMQQVSKESLLHEIVRSWVTENKTPDDLTEFLNTMEAFARNSARF